MSSQLIVVQSSTTVKVRRLFGNHSLVTTYIPCTLTRLPIEKGISPVNWLLLNHLEIKSENKLLIICHINPDDCSSTYKYRKLTRLPIEEGISPAN
jgi:hypothetical protein